MMKQVMSILLLAVCVLAFPAVQAGDDIELTTHDMGDGIYMIIGRGGNLGVSIGDDGIFLVDDQYAPLTPAIRATIHELAGAKRPVDFLLNTHFHGDHTGGNENFGKGGTLIVAHDNVRARMTTDEFRKSFVERGGESLEDALPVVTFNDQVSFHLNGETLRARHYPDAHTDGDSVIFFEGANVVHAGDLFFQVGYPFVDTDNGGSVKGLLQALDDIIESIDDETRIISGHGQPSDRAGLIEYRDIIETIHQRVKRHVQAGRTLAEIKEADVTADFDERWSWQFIDGERFVATIHAEVTEQQGK